MKSPGDGSKGTDPGLRFGKKPYLLRIIATASSTASTMSVTPVTIHSATVEVKGLNRITRAQAMDTTALMAGRYHLLFFSRSRSAVHYTFRRPDSRMAMP